MEERKKEKQQRNEATGKKREKDGDREREKFFRGVVDTRFRKWLKEDFLLNKI